MRSNVVEAVTGAIVLLVAGFFFYYAYTSSGVKPHSGYQVSAKFDRIDGLLEGNDIKLSGVKIGSVGSITIDPKTYLAIVEMILDGTILLPTDTTAQIVSESLMGGKYIALVPGGSEANLQPGDTIVHTQSAISFEGLLGKYLFSKSDENQGTEEHEKKSKA